MTKDQQIQAEAAAFRRLIEHLQKRSDVQNIDIMNLAGFCRNCLAKWYASEVKHSGADITYAEAQHSIYGMSIDEWKSRHQSKASDEQMKQFEDSSHLHAKISGY